MRHFRTIDCSCHAHDAALDFHWASESLKLDDGAAVIELPGYAGAVRCAWGVVVRLPMPRDAWQARL